MNFKRLLAGGIGTAALIAVALFALHSGLGQALLGHPSFVKYVANDHSTYYRLKVQLAYKGEEQDFDIVVGCNVRLPGYTYNGETFEIDLIPTVFGRRMSDGKGLVVRPPRACDGETTANGKIRRDVLPIVIVYDDVETLDFGTAYMSEDAYASPLSSLAFGGAIIETATRADFDEFRRSQINIVKRASYHSAISGDVVLQRMGLTRVARPWAHLCESYRRFRIPEDVRSLIRQHWGEDHPRFWRADNWQIERDLAEAITRDKPLKSDGENDPSRPFKAFGPVAEYAADRGLPTQGGPYRFPPAFYPSSTDYRLDEWPSNRQDWANYLATPDLVASVDIDFRNGLTRGFAYCFVRAAPDARLVTNLGARRIAGRIDSDTVAAKDTRGGWTLTPYWIFERDEYAWQFFRIELQSVRGDV
jgi:hypothetical protein